ncbi:glycoside hydrolase family 97 catalytic domain-containing protein [Streptomyces sp. 4N124]|uniref:glycoside hydrolase family 97 catalytic domain-containing protein n=1 Tax=Streptomyces sp. 4N124 TaxID=3457420 RepID=UPI003FD14360
MRVVRSTVTRALTVAACLAALCAPTAAEGQAAGPERSWRTAAPGGGPVSAQLSLTDSGGLTLTARDGRTTVLRPSALGIRTAVTDFSDGLSFVSRRDRPVHETYTTTTGARTRHTLDATESVFTFRKQDRLLRIALRVAADGVAYRYELPRGDGDSGTVTVLGETSQYAVPAQADSYLLPYDNGRQDYESIHNHTTLAQAKTGTDYGYPSLFRVDGDSWMLLGESGLDSSYAGSRLTLDRVDADAGRFSLKLPDPAEVATAPFATPWRTMVIGDLANLTESDLITDLAAPSKVADTSWIKPGKAAWSWWSDGQSPTSLAAQKKFVDFAAEQGWEHVLVDSGWSNDWMPELIAYAREKDVGVWLWVRWQTIDAASEINTLLPRWKSWGAVGLKIDFMESDGQDRMRWYDAIFAGSAKNELMLNFHGGTIPRGQQRTWPQLMTVEAVRGAEGTRPRPGREPFPAGHYTTLPFTRNVTGSMDFTPVTFTGVRPTSDAAELALSVVYESGVQHFADSVESYASRPLAERFLAGVPTVWDDTELVDGAPGDRAVFARRSGGEWFLGAVTSGGARTLDVSLGFLGSGHWLLDLYRDAPGGGLAVETREVTADSRLVVDVPANGGFAARVCPAEEGRTSCG